MFRNKKELPSPKPDPTPIIPNFKFWSVILILICFARIIFQLDAINASLRYDGKKQLQPPPMLRTVTY